MTDQPATPTPDVHEAARAALAAPAGPSVPVVDMLHFTHYDKVHQRRFVRALGYAFKNYGFVRLAHHGVSPDLVATAYEQAQSFFALSEDVKRQYGGIRGGQRGYTPFGAESAKDAKVYDLKEFFHVGPVLTPSTMAHYGYPQNVYVAELPDFVPALAQLHRHLQAVSVMLLRAVAQYFHQETDELAHAIVEGNSIVRALHYPPLPEEVPTGAVRAAAHEDINLITLLPEATGPGLEILLRDGSWLPVNALDGEFVVNVGDMLQRLTNGLMRSTTHRVVNPEDSRDARYSMPFFAHPHPAFLLSPWQVCREEGKPVMADITAGDYLHQRLVALGLI